MAFKAPRGLGPACFSGLFLPHSGSPAIFSSELSPRLHPQDLQGLCMILPSRIFFPCPTSYKLLPNYSSLLFRSQFKHHVLRETCFDSPG